MQAHRDIKPQNLFAKLHNDGWVLKIGDLGTSRMMPITGRTTPTVQCCTCLWRPPNVDPTTGLVTSDEYPCNNAFSDDVYSQACVILYMSTGGRHVRMPAILAPH